MDIRNNVIFIFWLKINIRAKPISNSGKVVEINIFIELEKRLNASRVFISGKGSAIFAAPLKSKTIIIKYFAKASKYFLVLWGIAFMLIYD